MSAKKKKPSKEHSGRLPLLPLKDMVVFPRMVLPLLIGRLPSIAAVEASLRLDCPLFLSAQRDATVENPGSDDLFTTGVSASVLQTLRMPDGTMKIIVEAIQRARILDVEMGEAMLEVEAEPIEIPFDDDKTTKALVRVVQEGFEDYVRQGQRIAPEVAMSFGQTEDADTLADLVCAHLALKNDERQELLELISPRKRLTRINEILTRENELLRIERKVRDRVRDQMEKGQREYFLQEQLRAIQQELGGREEGGDDFLELWEAIEKAKMPKEAKEKANREMARFERMPSMSPESAISRTYIEWLSEMPWSKRSKDKIDLEQAQKILDEDHYGLEKVKERILEFLAVRKLGKSTRGPVLCLVGPPGVGKTSLGKSIARAMGRKFVRVSLGGVRDEAEIRGHRRTYIGALPGRIIQSMKKVGVKNPVFVLDEIDKMNTDFRGDPSSALLEVLDPEQNKNFSDHYLEVDFDLHEVFFVTTSNSEYYIPEPLLDRMEIVELSGYSPFEKERIAELFLIPKQIKENGLSDKMISFTKKGIQLIIYRYTREAGVRELERQISKVCRKVARKVVSAKTPLKKIAVTEKVLLDLLGPPDYPDVVTEPTPQVGVAIGLAWTMSGGDTLVIESTVMKGKGDLRLTGQLGDVMQESAQAAYTYLRAHAKELGISTEFWRNNDIHVHLPEGAIPKDGPSAGGALAVSMLSALRKKAPLKRVSMTGEITLRGGILEIGGLKEKVLAAHRAGIDTVFFPKENEKDLRDVPKEVKQDITFRPVEHVSEIFAYLFESPKKIKPKKKAARKKPVPKKTTKKKATKKK